MLVDLIPSYFLVSSSAFLVYDCLLTIGLETELVWFSSFNWVTPVYLLQRYLPFVDTLGLFLFSTFFPTLSIQKCSIINHIGHWLHIIGTTLSEIVLTARAYAACQLRFNNGTLSITFAILAALFWIPVYVVMASETVQLGNIRLIPGLESGELSSNNCTMHSQQPFFFLTYVCGAAYNTVLLAMMIIAGYSDYKHRERVQLFNVVYRDGILYYVALIFISLANVVVIFTTSEYLGFLLMPLSRVMCSILTSRTVLHIREVMARKLVGSIETWTFNDIGVDESQMSTINFDSPESELESRPT